MSNDPAAPNCSRNQLAMAAPSSISLNTTDWPTLLSATSVDTTSSEPIEHMDHNTTPIGPSNQSTLRTCTVPTLIHTIDPSPSPSF